MSRGLLANIPGLSAHKAVVPATAFDRERAGRLVGDAVSLLSSLYPAGTLEWLKANRPDVYRYLVESEQDLDASIDAEDPGRFAKSLEIYVKRFQKAFDIFNERPPVMEVQGELL